MDDRGKGRAIISGLGKREELEQEKKGFWKEVKIEEELVKEVLLKQGDGEAVGVNELSGKVLKEVWNEKWGKEVIM